MLPIITFYFLFINCSILYSQHCGTIPTSISELKTQPWYDNPSYIDSLVKANEQFYISKQSPLKTDCNHQNASLYIPLNFNVFFGVNQAPFEPWQFREAIEIVNDLYRMNDIDVHFYLNCVNNNFGFPFAGNLEVWDLAILPMAALCNSTNSVQIFIGRDDVFSSMFVPAETL